MMEEAGDMIYSLTTPLKDWILEQPYPGDEWLGSGFVGLAQVATPSTEGWKIGKIWMLQSLISLDMKRDRG